MSNPTEPNHYLYQPTVLGVLAAELGEKAAQRAVNALVLHMLRNHASGDAPGMVLREGRLAFIELQRRP